MHPDWFTTALSLGAVAHESGEHGFYTVKRGPLVVTDCDTPDGMLVAFSTRTTDADDLDAISRESLLTEAEALTMLRGEEVATSDRVSIAKREIHADVEAGVVPATVPDFSALHDYVDANEYGALCIAESWGAPMDDESDDACEAHSQHTVDVGNALQGALDAWIRGGMA